jgi:hypothetical protein
MRILLLKIEKNEREKGLIKKRLVNELTVE